MVSLLVTKKQLQPPNGSPLFRFSANSDRLRGGRLGPGEDSTYPALLQKGMHFAVPALTKLFRASIALKDVTQAWNNNRKVFILTPGPHCCWRFPVNQLNFLFSEDAWQVGWDIYQGRRAFSHLAAQCAERLSDRPFNARWK